MKQAIFLDRDGVLVEDKGYIEDVDQVELFPFVVEALRRVVSRYDLFIVTNQSGVGLGLISSEGADRVNRYIRRTLAEEGIPIRELYCCPHGPADGCDCRKPHPYFMLQAARDYDLDLARSYMIGDHPSDVQFARNAGARGLYVLTGHGSRHRDQLERTDPVCRDMAAAIDWILNQEHPEKKK